MFVLYKSAKKAFVAICFWCKEKVASLSGLSWEQLITFHGNGNKFISQLLLSLLIFFPELILDAAVD